MGVGDLILFIVLLNGDAAHLCLHVYMYVCVHTYGLVLPLMLVKFLSALFNVNADTYNWSKVLRISD